MKKYIVQKVDYNDIVVGEWKFYDKQSAIDFQEHLAYYTDHTIAFIVLKEATDVH
jgi:hypothetical protein